MSDGFDSSFVDYLLINNTSLCLQNARSLFAVIKKYSERRRRRLRWLHDGEEVKFLVEKEVWLELHVTSLRTKVSGEVNGFPEHFGTVEWSQSEVVRK